MHIKYIYRCGWKVRATEITIYRLSARGLYQPPGSKFTFLALLWYIYLTIYYDAYSRSLLIWTDRQTNRTDCFTLCACTWGTKWDLYIIIVTHSHTVNVHWYQIYMYLYQQLYNSSPKVGLWIKGLECHMELHPNTTAIVLVQMSWLSLLFSAAFLLAGWQEDITHG